MNTVEKGCDGRHHEQHRNFEFIDCETVVTLERVWKAAGKNSRVGLSELE